MATEGVPSDGSTVVCTVVGGRSSFVGRSLVSMLLRSPAGWTVRIADSRPLLELDPGDAKNSILSDSIQTGRVSYFQVDVRDGSQISHAIRGSSVVFHMGALDAQSQDFYDQYMFIVQGTKNIINACRECKVDRLIYNSSVDVIFDGVHDICHGNESLPYPSKFEDVLNDLKAQAEALVLSANATDSLSTCALRSSNPFGPGDSHFVPCIVDEAKSGWAQFIIGSDKNMCDYTYVENIAHAHLCAENALCSGITPVAGEVSKWLWCSSKAIQILFI
uniref:3beta-hydroxysteroid-dehydrogenase/decarboxylase isoform 3 n=1 Tax=Anthurium amnicola TaxID=1678845 RepID=A0A1D1YUE0_9ARAE